MFMHYEPNLYLSHDLKKQRHLYDPNNLFLTRLTVEQRNKKKKEMTTEINLWRVKFNLWSSYNSRQGALRTMRPHSCFSSEIFIASVFN
jgi:hypothetical protein